MLKSNSDVPKKSIAPSEQTVSALGIINQAQHEANQRAEAGESRKQELLSILPEPKPGLSGWTTVGFKESLIPGCLAGVEPILQTEYIFVTDTTYPDFDLVFKTNMKNKYELVDINGKRLFFAAETMEAWSEYPSNIRSIAMNLFGAKGGNICEITGSQKVYTVMKNNSNQLGSFKANSGDGIFYINDESGMKLLRAVPVVVKGKTEYKVEDCRTKASVGQIKPTWLPGHNNEEEGVHVIMPDMFGVQYDKEMDPNCKMLLICLMMTLYFQENEPPFYGENKKSYIIGIMYNLVVGGIILIMICIIIVLSQLYKKKKSMKI